MFDKTIPSSWLVIRIRWKFTYPQVWNYPLSTRSSFFFPSPSPRFHSSAAFISHRRLCVSCNGCASNIIVTDKIHGFGSPLPPVSSWEWGGGEKNWRDTDVSRGQGIRGGPNNLVSCLSFDESAYVSPAVHLFHCAHTGTDRIVSCYTKYVS